MRMFKSAKSFYTKNKELNAIKYCQDVINFQRTDKDR